MDALTAHRIRARTAADWRASSMLDKADLGSYRVALAAASPVQLRRTHVASH
jgi:hypothetical protein